MPLPKTEHFVENLVAYRINNHSHSLQLGFVTNSSASRKALEGEKSNLSRAVIKPFNTHD
jgi:hypothetical protein